MAFRLSADAGLCRGKNGRHSGIVRGKTADYDKPCGILFFVCKVGRHDFCM